jgi:hypothetical protein
MAGHTWDNQSGSKAFSSVLFKFNEYRTVILQDKHVIKVNWQYTKV